jgi:hypothetical protein
MGDAVEGRPVLAARASSGLRPELSLKPSALARRHVTPLDHRHAQAEGARRGAADRAGCGRRRRSRISLSRAPAGAGAFRASDPAAVGAELEVRGRRVDATALATALTQPSRVNHLRHPFAREARAAALSGGGRRRAGARGYPNPRKAVQMTPPRHERCRRTKKNDFDHPAGCSRTMLHRLPVRKKRA